MNVSEIIRQFDFTVTADDIICTAGVAIFGGWLLKTSMGRKALTESMPRRHNMPAYMPFVPLLIWFGAVSAAMSASNVLLRGLVGWEKAFADNLILCAGAIIAIAVIIFLAKWFFAEGTKGLGLRAGTICRDFPIAIMNLASIWPIVVLMLMLTILAGQFIYGRDFKMPQHEELEVITMYPQMALRVLIIITTVIVVPVFEEMLFRGLFQTLIRSIFVSPWRSVVISSAIFVMAHPTIAHWPALFALSMCLGYSYEKSGSLFRPIFIHSLFNGISIIAALYQ
jgi:membrane protease YdiL (CAAX protease family)